MRQFATRLAVAAVIFAAFAAAPLHAQEPVFPPNSRVGLTPPPGFTPSTRFPGFENPQASAAILLVDLPAEAFAQIETGFSDEALKARGMTVEKRDAIELKDGSGTLVIAQHTAATQKRRDTMMMAKLPGATVLISVQMLETSREAVSDEAVRDALKTVTVRTKVPDEEKLSILPYRLSELSGFRIVRSAGDGSALLTDGPQDMVASVEQPFVLVALAPGEPPKPEDRDAFARRVFASAPGLKEVRIMRAEPMRINNQAGYEILAEAKDAQTGTDVTTVQWLRFGRGGYLHIFAIARKDVWASIFPRLRAIRDGIETR
jgi:hypothetical protein